MRYIFISIFVIFSLLISSCSTEKAETVAENKTSIQNASQVKVYYFHCERRCPTCVAVGEVTKTTIAEQYKDNKNVEFVQINIDEPENKELAEKFQVTSSGLFVTCNDQSEDITAFAFQTARTSPEKLQSKLIELIEQHI